MPALPPATSEERSEQVRALSRRLPYFTVRDIATTTGIPPEEVRAALGTRESEQEVLGVARMMPVYKMPVRTQR